MKRLFLVLPFLALIACSNTQPNWVYELESKNPLKEDTNFVSVYFRFDTIINDFEVSGILYPSYYEEYGWDAYENGVRLFFHNIKTGKEYVWTDWDEESRCFKLFFMSKNVRDIVSAKKFRGFKSGDYYVFRYDTTHHYYSDNDLLPYAEYQFFDADFDGEEELILGYYAGGPKGSPWYQVYEITDSVLVEKLPIGETYVWGLDICTTFDTINKTIINILYDGCCDWGTYAYKADDEGKLYLIYHASTQSDHEHNILESDTTFFEF